MALSNKELQFELAKAILFYADNFHKIVSVLETNLFDYYPIQVALYLFKKYFIKYETVPTYRDLYFLLKKNLNQFTFIEKEKELSIILDIFKYVSKEKKDVLEYDIFFEELQTFLKRKKLEQNYELIRDAILEGKDIDRIPEQLKQDLSKVTLIKDLGFTADDLLNMETPPRYGIFPTGLSTIDYWMDGGLARKELGLIKAPPGIGKTTIKINFAYNNLLLGFDVLYITLEMPAAQIFTRFISRYTSIPFSQFKDKSIKEVLTEKNINLDDFNELFKHLRIKEFIPGTSFFDIDAYISSLVDETNFNGIIFVDYLNEISFPYANDLWVRLEKVSNAFDVLANKLKMPIWVSAQDNPKQGFGIYGSKVGALKKLTFGLELKAKEDSTGNHTYLSFFKNRLHGIAIKPVELEYIRDSGELRELMNDLDGSIIN